MQQKIHLYLKRTNQPKYINLVLFLLNSTKRTKTKKRQKKR